MASTAAPLDHGILNTPLASRYGKGGINAAFDQYNAATAKAEKAAWRAQRQTYRADLAQAKALIDGLSEARLTQLGSKRGLTAKACRDALLSAARSNPARSAAILQKEAAQ